MIPRKVWCVKHPSLYPLLSAAYLLSLIGRLRHRHPAGAQYQASRPVYREAAATGFRPEVLEKVFHLLTLLEGFQRHPFLPQGSQG